MPRAYQCPYFVRDQINYIKCEGCRVQFPNSKPQLQYIQDYCANISGYKRCTIARALDIHFTGLP